MITADRFVEIVCEYCVVYTSEAEQLSLRFQSLPTSFDEEDLGMLVDRVLYDRVSYDDWNEMLEDFRFEMNS